MTSPVHPNISNFLGVALVVNRSRDGPRFVFHYPSQILPARNSRAPRNKAANELDEDDDDALLDQMIHPSWDATSGPLPKTNHLQNWNHDDHLVTESGSQIVPWEHVAGYPTKDLESILTPTRAYHKRLFQVSLDQLCFVSYPIYVPENGIWRRKKKQPKYQPPKSPENGESATKDGRSSLSAGGIPTIETKDMADDAVGGDEAEGKKSSMTMFNLVFILNPKKHEVKDLAETLYFHIIKKINKLLRYSQQRSDFVWKESKRILTLKDKAREEKTRMCILWKDILEASSLAACMQDVYEAVSHNKIAALQLETAEGAITHSVQVPMPFYVTDLPPCGSRDDAHGSSSSSRGLWITTANYFVEEDSQQDPALLDKNFGLLLMGDEKKIVAELQADADADDTTAAMVEFVRLSKPTLSFHQIGHQGANALSPAQVRKYAQHFIFWRRAIAVPPLHARDVYILSPNADFSLLPTARLAWSRAFPLAPELPDFLADLSAAPRPYKWFCPSKNHRPTYLAMLGWLMRDGWVTQLCTFAYVVVWPEIQYEVDYEADAQDLRAAHDKENTAASPPSSPSRPHTAASSVGSHDEARNVTPTDELSDAEPEEFGFPYVLHHDPLSLTASRTHSRPRSHSGQDPDDDPHEPVSPGTTSAAASPTSASTPAPPPVPTINERAAEAARLERLATRTQRALHERSAAFARKPTPQATDHPSLNTAAPHLAHLDPLIIVDARRAAGRESLYLSAIGRRFRDPKVRAAWPVFWKYFNGKSALERVALCQDMKRKETWALLTAMSEHLVCVRHW
ncbi:nitrogen permease regulator of amino acid transport activity 3-domain-containing protein [Xylariaceae sp. FL0016]|nr:nitrogen permease regulator of amino acid transport activity 3-domain-containing protein [Xylariaceae sp. FL0016]